mmetsp:Transcript_13490/g.16658  ORF Transcript_13490/g.16658 Transcript_13490/m.16658 type:complete len:215 (-) Transcript_13490:461-1105(-)
MSEQKTVTILCQTCYVMPNVGKSLYTNAVKFFPNFFVQRERYLLLFKLYWFPFIIHYKKFKKMTNYYISKLKIPLNNNNKSYIMLYLEFTTSFGDNEKNKYKLNNAYFNDDIKSDDDSVPCLDITKFKSMSKFSDISNINFAQMVKIGKKVKPVQELFSFAEQKTILSSIRNNAHKMVYYYDRIKCCSDVFICRSTPETAIPIKFNGIKWVIYL